MTCYEKNARKMKLISKITLSVSFLMLLLLCSGRGFAETGSSTLRAMTEGLEKNILLKQEGLVRLSGELPQLQEDLQRGIEKAEDRLNQIMLLQGVAGRTPWAYRTILVQLRSLETYLELKKEPLVGYKSLLARSKNDFNMIRNLEMKNMKRNDPGESSLLGDALDQYRILKKRVQEVKAVIDNELVQADKLMADIQTSRKLILEEYTSAFTGYYLEPSLGVLTDSGQKATFRELRQWLIDLPRFYYPLIVWVEWQSFVIYFVLSGLLFYGVLRYSLGKMHKRLIAACHADEALKQEGDNDEEDGEGAEEDRLYSQSDVQPGDQATASPCAEDTGGINWGLILFCTGLGMFMSLHLTIFTKNQLTIFMPGGVGALGLLMMTDRFLKDRPRHLGTTVFSSPLFPLFLLYVLGDMLQIFNIPQAGIGAVWIFGLVGAILAVKRLRRKSNLIVNKLGTGATYYLLIIFAIATVLGFATQSMVLTQLWFGLLLTIRSCMCLKKFVTTLASASAGNSGDGREKPSMLLVAYPVSVAFITVSYIYWALKFVGGQAFAKWVMRLQWDIGGTHLTLRSVLWVFIAFFITRFILFWIKTVIDFLSSDAERLTPAIGHTIKTAASYTFWVLFLVFALGVLGVPVSSLTWIASGLSVGIGFGMKDLVNNFISGLIIMFGGSIKKGDIIQMGTTMGEVADVSVRNTTVRTFDNNYVIYPNTNFMNGEITNWSYGDSKMRLIIPVSVFAGSKIPKVEKAMLKVAKKNKRILKDPAPRVLFKGFGQLGMDFELQVWINDFEGKFEAESELALAMDKMFKEKKILIAYRTTRKKYKPKGSEAMQLEAQREALKLKRREFYKTYWLKKRGSNLVNKV